MSTPPTSGGMPTVATLVSDCFRLLRQQRDQLLRVGLAPALAVFLIEILVFTLLVPEAAAPVPADGGAMPSAPDPRLLQLLLIFLLDAVPMTLFAVNWLRVQLLGPSAVTGLGLRWGLREMRFLLRSLLIWLLAGIAVGLPMGFVLTLTAGIPGVAPLLLVAATLGNLYIVLRLSFSLVALAIDGSMSLPESWRATRDVSGRLFPTVILAALPFLVTVLVVSILLDASGLSAAAPYSVLLVEAGLGLLVPAGGLTALAVVYLRLAGRPRGST